MGDAPNISKRGTYRPVRIHAVDPQIRKGREFVATVALLKHSGSGEVEYILKDVSKIALK